MIGAAVIGAESLDHIAIPTRDLPRSEKFYLDVIGLTFLAQRKNADGSPRHTYVTAGDNIVGLTLPGVHLSPSISGAPRFAIAQTRDAFQAAIDRLKTTTGKCAETQHAANSPFVRSCMFNDPDDNHMELCVRRQPLPANVGLSHVIFETTDLARANRFYTEALGLKRAGEICGETLFEFPNGQMLGVKEVPELSDRTKKKGRACHVAFNVSQEDFESMVSLIPTLGGRSLGDFRASDGLRAPGERSIYFFDPDTNYLQITALGEEDWSLMSDE
jgi:catechol 2,3-dioxygenase-like lactoylglutathione lyase family enzyme